MWILLALVAGAILVLIVANLSSSEKKIEHEIEHLYAVGDPQFLRSMGTLLGPAILTGNRVTALSNGDEIFPAMLEAIRGAQRTITFETYIYWSGAIGKAFAGRAGRARAGRREGPRAARLGRHRQDGRRDARSRWSRRAWRSSSTIRSAGTTWDALNNRTHRKLLVVDGRIGFTGGVGIADNWLGNAQDPDHWRDSHFRWKARPSRRCRRRSWTTGSRPRGRVLHGDDYFPELKPAGPHAGPDLQELGERGERERAADVPALDRRGARRACASPTPTSSLTTWRCDPRGRAAPRRGGRDHRAGPAYRRQVVRRASRVALGAAARGGRRDLRVPADDVPLQGHGRGRAAGPRSAPPISTTAPSG